MFERPSKNSTLLAGYFRGQLNTGQLEELELWLNAAEENSAYFDLLKNEKFVNEEFRKFESFGEGTKTAIWNRMTKHLDLSFEKAPVKVKPAVFTTKLWKYIPAAASIVLVFGLGFYYYQHMILNANYVQFSSGSIDLAPGKTGATLTLANGRRIRLSEAANGELFKEAGVKVSKAADGQIIYEIAPQATKENKTLSYNTLSTTNGETYQVVLPDQSKVWLNAASSIIYPTSFASLKERRIKLKGEAYFEIAKDKAHPFIVATSHQEVEVLGTHFNVNAYPDEPDTRTTLLEGRILVGKIGKVDAQDPWSNPYPPAILEPGEQGILQGENIKVVKADTEMAVAWKNNKFVFDNEDIESIMRKLSRWYNIEVIYQGDFSKRTFDGSISRQNNISKILDKITFTQAVHFKIEGRRVTVMP